MNLFNGASILGGSNIIPGATVAGGLINGGVQDYFTWKNYQLQKDQYKYQKNLQNTMFNREDNAVQRRTADLIAAGLSPVLAAGSAAQAGPVVNTSAPQIGNISDKTKNIMDVMALMKMQQDISLTGAQKELIKSQIRQNDVNTKTNDWNLKFYKDNNQPTNTSGIVKDVSQIMGMGKSNQVNNVIKGLTDKLEDSKRTDINNHSGAWQKLDWLFLPQGTRSRILKNKK